MKGHCDHCYGYDSINDDNDKMGNDNSDKMTMLMMRTMISGHQGDHYNQYGMMIFYDEDDNYNDDDKGGLTWPRGKGPQAASQPNTQVLTPHTLHTLHTLHWFHVN